MGKPVMFALTGNEALAKALSNYLDIELGAAAFHTFPDGESFIRIDSDVKDKTAILICTLDHPDNYMQFDCSSNQRNRSCGSYCQRN